MWKKALRIGRSSPGPAGWLGLEYVETIEDLRPLQGAVRLACLETVRYCSVLSLEETSDETCRSLTNPLIEVARFDCADRAQCFRDSEEMSSSGISGGESISALWLARFAPLAKVSQHVSIVDPYSLQDGEGVKGLARFLAELNRTARSTSLAMFAACQILRTDGTTENAHDLITKVQLIAQGIGPGGIRSLDITLVPIRYFREDSHGRYIRFDNAAIELDLGVSLFNQDIMGLTWRRCQFTFKRATSFHHSTESELRSHSELGSPWNVR